jgi:formate hydrogenlyase subunit 3/multisubunit Na+/H+ antiporter MnhD subunit
LLRVTSICLAEPGLVVGRVTAALGLHERACTASSTRPEQATMKRLLAYSSIENIGIIVAGIGLSMLFTAYGKSPLRGAGHDGRALSRAQPRVFKTLLFLATGSVMHATRERSLGRLAA